MAQVVVEIGGRRYELTCRDGEEARLQLLGRQVDAKTAQVAQAIGKPSEARELLLIALLLADELDEAREALALAEQVAEAQRSAVEQLAGRLETLATRLEKSNTNA